MDPINLVVASHHGVKLAFSSQLGDGAAESSRVGGFGSSPCCRCPLPFGGSREHPNSLGAHFGKVNAKVFQQPVRATPSPFHESDQAARCFRGRCVVPS